MRTVVTVPYNTRMLNGADYALTGLAAAAAGGINALAGGGTLITFPLLLGLGVPPISANVTNTIALCPGFIGGILGQIRDLAGQRRRFWTFLAASATGGVAGALVLLNTGERAFMGMVPWLILTASCLLAFQGAVRAWLVRRSLTLEARRRPEFWALLIVGLLSIYGGYFGVAMSVLVLPVLCLMIDEGLTRLNAIKQTVAFGANGAAAVLFLFSGRVNWTLAAVMALGALAGGTVGGRLAGRIRPDRLRWTVVTLGLVLAVVYFLR